jgi:hypothetical protein
MTSTATTSKAQTEADTYAAYLANGENKSKTGRVLGVGASTVADRIKRHLARVAEAEAVEREAAEQAGLEALAAEARALNEAQASEAEMSGPRDVYNKDGQFIGTEETVDIPGEEPAADVPAEPVKPPLVSECTECGYHFSRPQRRQTCQSAAACTRRQEAKTADAM